MVKFHFGLGGDDDNTPNDENQTTPATDDGANPVGENNAGTTPPATDQPPVTEAPVVEEKTETSEPVIEKVAEPIEKKGNENPFAIPTVEETKETVPTPTLGNGTKPTEPVIPAATESPVLPTENPFASNGNATPVEEKKTEVPKPIIPETTVSDDAFSPAPAGTLQKPIAPIQETKKVGGTAPGLEPLTPPVADKEPVKPVDNGGDDKKEENTFAPTSTPTFGGGGSTSASGADPAQTLKKVKDEIEGYVKEHKDKIKDYQGQIDELNEKIKQEKSSLRKKHDEFADLLREMNELTRDFGNGDGNGGNGNGGQNKPHYRKPAPRK